MCFFDVVRYICSGEEYLLVEKCCLPNHCVPHIRQTLHSTAVCELCGRAWEVSALSERAYEAVTTPIIESGQLQTGYFDYNPAAPGATSDSATPMEEVAEGLYKMKIAMPMIPSERPALPAAASTRSAYDSSTGPNAQAGHPTSSRAKRTQRPAEPQSLRRHSN